MTKESQKEICKLCGIKAKLLKRSHIIPNFMYKSLKDELNRMILIDFNSPFEKGRFEQTGYFDKYILCSKCDNERISKWEKYADLLIYGGNGKSAPRFQHAVGPDGVKSIIVDNIDFRKFKLFVLSILWRASISSQNFFEHIDLGDSAETIRKLLLEEDSLTAHDFKISLIGVKANKEIVKLVSMPRIIKIGKGDVAVFFISGLFYFIDLIPNSDFALFSNHYITDSGKYEIMLLDGEKAVSFMSAYGLPESVLSYYFQ